MRNFLFMLLSAAMVLSVDAWADTPTSAATNIKKKKSGAYSPSLRSVPPIGYAMQVPAV